MEQMNYFQMAAMVIKDPKGFFETVKDDGSFLRPFLYGVSAVSAYVVLSALIGLINLFNIPQTELIIFQLLFQLLMLPIQIILGVAGLFVISGIIHLILMILGSTKGFIQTFKIYCYSYTLSFLFLPIAVLATVIQLANPGTASILGLAFLLIPIIMLVVYYLYVEIIGAMVLHELSAWRAILGVFIIPLIIAVIIGLLLLTFFVALFYSLGNSITGAVTGGLL